MENKNMARPMNNIFNNSYSEKCIYNNFSNYRTLSMISHPSKMLSRIILNRLIPQVEKKTSRILRK